MGNAQSESHSYGGDMKSSVKMRLPLPEKEELETRFNKVLVSLGCYELLLLAFVQLLVIVSCIQIFA